MYIVHNCLLVKTKDLKKQKYSQMYSSFEVKIPKQTTEFSLSQNIYPGNINNQIMVNSESQKNHIKTNNVLIFKMLILLRISPLLYWYNIYSIIQVYFFIQIEANEAESQLKV